jgi:mannosidase alpha-like ER degradation enhancer 1
MEGYLPIPQRLPNEAPTEVILRFSTASQSPELIIESQSLGQVFLHAVGATATFGRSFSANPKLSSQFTIHSAPIELVYHATSDGCEPFTLFPDDNNGDDRDRDSSGGRDEDRDVIVMLDRGGCPFLDKLVHTSRAGGKGLIVAGLSPTASQGMGMIDTDGLIRPSADDESPELLKEVEGMGLVYIDWKSGDVLRDTFESYASMSSHNPEGAGAAGGPIVMVDIMSLDGQSDSSQTSSYASNNLSTSSSKAREGRVGVGEHVIWNLRIVEAP